MSIIPKKYTKEEDSVISLNEYKHPRTIGLHEAIGRQKSWRLAREMMATEAWRHAPAIAEDIRNAKAILAGKPSRYAPNLEHPDRLLDICINKVMFWWKKVWGEDAGFLCEEHSDHEVRGYRTKVLPNGEHVEVEGEGAFFIIATSYPEILYLMLKKWDTEEMIPKQASFGALTQLTKEGDSLGLSEEAMARWEKVLEVKGMAAFWDIKITLKPYADDDEPLGELGIKFERSIRDERSGE